MLFFIHIFLSFINFNLQGTRRNAGLNILSRTGIALGERYSINKHKL